MPIQQNMPEQEQTTESTRGMRNLEEKYNNLVRRVQVGEQNVLAQNKKIHSELKTINSEITEINRQLEELKDKINFIAKELSTTAKKDEVEVLKKYLNLWEPINFVTQNEVDKLIKRAIEEEKEGNK